MTLFIHPKVEVHMEDLGQGGLTLFMASLFATSSCCPKVLRSWVLTAPRDFATDTSSFRSVTRFSDTLERLLTMVPTRYGMEARRGGKENTGQN